MSRCCLDHLIMRCELHMPDAYVAWTAELSSLANACGGGESRLPAMLAEPSVALKSHGRNLLEITDFLPCKHSDCPCSTLFADLS